MKDLSWKLASLGQLSILMEVSSPKPGNVNRLIRFSDTGYRHFLASASLASRGLFIASKRGVEAASGRMELDKLGLGEIIKECAKDIFTGINRRNTILGTLLLHVPLLMASSATIYTNASFDIGNCRKWIGDIIDNTTVQDTINLYEAFHLARPRDSPKRESSDWTEQHTRYDIDNPGVFENIVDDQMTLRDLFRLSAEVDSISREWTENYRLTLTRVFPYLDSISKDLEDLEEGIVKTFIWLLSAVPDGLIVKKAGLKKARSVQDLAKRIVEEGLDDRDPSELLVELDRELRSEGNTLNPGTTADMVSVAIYCKLVTMYYK